ncbi:hypothetical protein QD228_03455 [Cobetia sp. 3AK]|uniref:hypothetical protein n=1 Tax=Cobetia sp. 3AK TaxID=3040020 RepID=UPI0024484C67|nr:hypothetical protein [Cobetia sp. 3AK]MDH2372894.1 hypothetical protein [Cobetia sp. 3AK]
MSHKFGFTGQSTMFVDFAGVLSKGWYVLLSSLGTIMLAVAGFFAKKEKLANITDWSYDNHSEIIDAFVDSSFVWVVLGGVLFFLGMWGSYKDQEEQQNKIDELALKEVNAKDLEKQLEAASEELRQQKNSAQEVISEKRSQIKKIHEELVGTWLKSVYKQFEFQSTERITIYYENLGGFSLLARYSKNPEFNKQHRQKFAINQGVISKAWRHDECIELECPTSDDIVRYRKHLRERYGYDNDKIDSLTMKSCRYFAKAIVDADVHKGVIVFESENPDLFTQEKIRDFSEHCNQHQAHLAEFVRDGLQYSKTGQKVSVEAEIIKMVESES